ncbi:hypothetical protein MMC30_000522 [Trapelia coarctata]|nr:hypothetical protein [Trapelia coarctata]
MLSPLLVSEGGNWKLSKDGFALERIATFDSFEDTKIYNYVFIRLRTHKDIATRLQGISTLDLKFAHFCDNEIEMHNGTIASRLGRGRYLLDDLVERKEAAEDQERSSSEAKAEGNGDRDPAAKARKQDELRNRLRSTKKIDDQLDLATKARIDDEVRTIMRRVHSGDFPAREPVTMPAWQKDLQRDEREGMVEDQERNKGQDGFSSSANVDRKGDPDPPAKEDELPEDQHTEEDDVPNLRAWKLWKRRAEIMYDGPHSWKNLLLDAEKSGIPMGWVTRHFPRIVDAYERRSSSSTPPMSSDSAPDVPLTDHIAPTEERKAPEKSPAASETLPENHRLWLDRARTGIHERNLPFQELHDQAVVNGLDSAWAWKQLAMISATNREVDEKKDPSSSPSSSSSPSTPSSPPPSSSSTSSSPQEDTRALFPRPSKSNTPPKEKRRTGKSIIRNDKIARKQAKRTAAQAAAKAEFRVNFREAARAASAEEPESSIRSYTARPASEADSRHGPSSMDARRLRDKGANRAERSESKATRHWSPFPPDSADEPSPPVRAPGSIPLGLPSAFSLGASGGDGGGRVGGGRDGGGRDGDKKGKGKGRR